MKLYVNICTILALSCNVLSDTTERAIQDAASSYPNVIKTFHVEHAIIPNTFTPRGIIQISIDDEGKLESTFRKTTEGYLSDEELNGLDEIIANNGYYKVRVKQDDTTAAGGAGGGSASVVLASAPGCDVKRANFREEIGILLGNTGSIISLSYKPLVSPLAPQCHELDTFAQEATEKGRKENDFKTKISLSTATPGTVIPAVLPNSRPPMGYNWIKRSPPKTNVPKEGDEGTDSSGGGGGGGPDDAFFDPLKDEKPQQQSFLRRYWYIILPIVIMTFMGPEEPAAPTQSRNGGETGGGISGGSGSNKIAAVGGSKQRRGKRG